MQDTLQHMHNINCYEDVWNIWICNYICVHYWNTKQKLTFLLPPELIVSVVMALAFLALVVVMISAAPPALAKLPLSSISSEDSGSTAS